MKIRRRNKSKKSFFISILLISAVLSLLFYLSIIPEEHIFGVITIGLCIIMYKTYTWDDALSQEEIKYVEDASELTISQKNPYGYKFYEEIIWVGLMIYAYDYSDVYSWLVIFIIMCNLVIIIRYKLKKNQEFWNEFLYFTPTLIIYQDDEYELNHIVINIAQIKELKLTKSSLLIRDKHGKLEIETKDLNEKQISDLTAKVNEIAASLCATPDYKNVAA